jgi:hypothetical protein
MYLRKIAWPGKVFGPRALACKKNQSSGLMKAERSLHCTRKTHDGITEAENAELEEFGGERLLEAARARHGSALEVQRARHAIRSRPSVVGISATTRLYWFYESVERRREPTPRYVRGGSTEVSGYRGIEPLLLNRTRDLMASS